MIIYGYRDDSSILPLQVQDTFFSVMVLVCHINLTVPFHWTLLSETEIRTHGM